DIKLTIVGRNPSPSLQKLMDNVPEVELTGWVEDTRPYINQSMLFIVPLRIGGGTRMKIYEAMSMGKTVVSTQVGAEGLPVEPDENIILVDDPQEFGETIIELLENKQIGKSIGRSASSFVRRNFSWQQVASKFSDICLSVHDAKRPHVTSSQ
ncbi:MAG: glycosyltransferase, partial [Candidatus Peribacteraceae bacterium]|nr:glycosyltransferase [Candidatus Peribacteraceae bacterium]